jgi:hypothetical protein
MSGCWGLVHPCCEFLNEWFSGYTLRLQMHLTVDDIALTCASLVIYACIVRHRLPGCLPSQMTGGCLGESPGLLLVLAPV